MSPRILAVAALLLPGCLGGEPGAADVLDTAAVAWSELALPVGEGHDHFLYEHHADLSTPNFEIVGHDPLFSPTAGRTVGGHHCGDAQTVRDGRRIAALEARYLGGFVLADVTNPADPKWLGEFVMRTSRVYDVAVVPDGRHVLLVTTGQTPVPLPAVPPFDTGIDWRPACDPERVTALTTEDPVPRPFSLLLVDISDPAAPRLVDQRPIPLNGHSAYAVDLGGTIRILVSVYGTAPVNGYYQVYGLTNTPAGGRLELLSTIVLKQLGAPPQFTTAHDGWISKHPKTGQVLAYLAGGPDFFIYDITDARNPRFLSRWSDYRPDAASHTGSLHSVFPIDELWHGRHYTVLGPEWGGHPGPLPSGVIWVLDTTDPAKPLGVGAWTLPHEVEWNGTYMFSNHYFGVHHRTLFVSMYHGGLWAVDLSGIGQDGFQLLPSVGVFLPDQPSPKPPLSLQRWTPTLQEVLPFSDGILITFDGASGIYTLRFDASKPMPAPEPWPIEPVTTSR